MEIIVEWKKCLFQKTEKTVNIFSKEFKINSLSLIEDTVQSKKGVLPKWEELKKMDEKNKRIRGKVTMLNILKENSFNRRKNFSPEQREQREKEIALFIELEQAIIKYFN